MNWFFIAILGPLLWSLTNHLDKYLLSKHLDGIGKGALILYSTFFGAVVLPFVFFFERNIFEINILQISILISAGIVSAVALFLYLYALELDEASIVVPFFQTIPIFGFILAFYLLGETITNSQLVGAGVILIGGVALSIEIGNGSKYIFKKKLLFLMLLSSFLFALYEVLFKVVAIDVGFLISSFWQYVGLLIFGLFLYFAIKSYRDDFHTLLERHTKQFFALNVANESLTVAGNSFYNFAILLAPAALVMSTTAYQPMFVFLIGTTLTFMAPGLVKEKVSWRDLGQKATAIILVIIGTYIMFI